MGNAQSDPAVPQAVDHDLIIVGGGAAGLGAARAARWVGADVALINDGPPGGDCTFTGCVPSKTLLAAARDGLDFGAAMKRVERTVAAVAESESAEVLRSRGVTVINDRATVVTHDTVRVGVRRLTAPRLLIATGARPSRPPIDGLDSVPVLTNVDLFDLTERPEHLGIIGGGAIGCEMAEAFIDLGSQVTVFEAMDRVLSQEEPAASAIVQRRLETLGVDVRTSALIERADRGGKGGIQLKLTDQSAVDVTHLLVATGRTANSQGFGLEEIGADLDDQGHIVTTDRLQTSIRGIYAAGDVTGRLPFTHAADEMGRLAAGNALKKGYRGRYRSHHTPWVTFTSPEVARVGLTEADAASRRGRVAILPLEEIDRGLTDEQSDGFVKLVAGPRRLTRNLFGGQILGATIVAPRAGEMINEIALAMRAGVFTGRLAQTVHAYPTWGYGIQKAAAQFFGDVEGKTARRARA